MSKFALERMEAVSGKQSFDKLVVEGNIPFDDFEKGLESSDKQYLEESSIKIKKYNEKVGVIKK